MEEGAHHGGRPKLAPGGRGADLIGALPEDLLLQVLARLRCARAAARTSLLSRRWRGLWTRLNGFTLRDVALRSLLPALNSLALSPEVLLLDIRVPEVPPSPPLLYMQYAARVSSLLRAAAGLSPVELRLDVPLCAVARLLAPDVPCHSLTVHLPCFHRATTIELHGLDLLFADPPASCYMFPALEVLSLYGCRVHVAALVRHCPRLRVLRATGCLHGDDDFAIRSESLQELVVVGRGKWTGCMDVEVPALNRLVLSVLVGDEFSVSISAPVVEKVSWRCCYSRAAAAGIGLWGLAIVRLETESNVLSLWMDCLRSFRFPHTELSLAQEIEKHLVVTTFSVLDLHFITTGHAFGAFLFRLLRIHWIRTATKSLKIGLRNIQGKEKAKTCPVNCLCDEPDNWRSQTISLINLEEVEIKVFEGEDHEFDVLRLIFKCAPVLKRMTLRLSDEATRSNVWCTKIYDIFKAYPLVECSVDPSFDAGPAHSSQSGAST